MLRGVLNSAASRIGVSRGTKEHEELAVQLLQLAEIIPDKERLVAALSNGARLRSPIHNAEPADTLDRAAM